VLVQVYTALPFFAQGAYYRVTRDSIGVSTSTLSIVIHAVTRALAKRVQQFVVFPNIEDIIASTKRVFYAINDFPSVVGVIDCTHVEI
jgi:hypothetical protein